MNKIAYFSPHDGRVLQWIDTEALSYNLPDASLLHACSEAEWELQHHGEMMVKDGIVVPFFAVIKPPTTEQLIAEYEAALDAHLDAVAQLHRYRDRVTFALRAGFPNPWREQGSKFGTWMDECNQQAYALLAAVLAGEAEMPSKEAFIASLPEFVLS